MVFWLCCALVVLPPRLLQGQQAWVCCPTCFNCFNGARELAIRNWTLLPVLVFIYIYTQFGELGTGWHVRSFVVVVEALAQALA